MTDVVLAYPFFRGRTAARRQWLFPPLGLGYLADSLRRAGVGVRIVDGTFRSMSSMAAEIEALHPAILGLHCSIVTQQAAWKLAGLFAGRAFLVAGGPQATLEPQSFESFDAVVVGEGEESFTELSLAFLERKSTSGIPGVAVRSDGKLIAAQPRAPISDLDALVPARDLFDNDSYRAYWRDASAPPMTSIMSSRGCPFDCRFCSRPAFGRAYRARSPEKVVEEMTQIRGLGYTSAWFADDVFTLNPARLRSLCEKLIASRLGLSWSCLSRIEAGDPNLLTLMKQAGCSTIHFGLESGSDRMLRAMGKRITVQQASEAVRAARKAGIGTDGFFMVGYPGEDTESLLATVELSSRLPLDRMSYSIAYPLPGTPFYDEVKERLLPERLPIEGSFPLAFRSDLSETKLKAAMLLASVRFRLRAAGTVGRALDALASKVGQGALRWLK